MTLAEKICVCRKKAGLSQEALAEKLGVSRQAVSRWENGEAVPEVGKLPALAREFGVTVDWLLSEEPEIPRAATRRTYEGIKAENVGKVLKKWCWLVGAFIALRGVYSMVVGLMAQSLMNHVGGSSQVRVTVSGGLVSQTALWEAFGGRAADTVTTATNGMILWGLLEIVAGVLLALWLKGWGDEHKEL